MISRPPYSYTGIRTFRPQLGANCRSSIDTGQNDTVRLGDQAVSACRKHFWGWVVRIVASRPAIGSANRIRTGKGASCGRKKLCQGNPQRSGDLPQIEDGDIPLAALDRADESAVQAAPLAQFFLGQLERRPPFANSIAKFSQKRAFF
jgi:hypothetical protein